MTQLVTVLSELERGQYQRTMVAADDKAKTSNNNNSSALKPSSGKIIYADRIIK